jgi:signal transduction histidine kinase
VSARTILQLGGELISSDGIAFYELIKNAVDAGSPKVFVDVVVRLPAEVILEASASLGRAESSKTDKDKAVERVKETLINAIVPDRPDAEDWIGKISGARQAEELLALLPEANSITFRDAGSGMTLQQLDTLYLTVGTPHRLEERDRSRAAGEKKVITGEKGIGRLAAMRLGNRLLVQTSTSEDTHWNELRIDWTAFGRDFNQLLEDVEVAPVRGPRKTTAGHGTTITITDLNTAWSVDKLHQIANSDLSRFTDPFADKVLLKMHLHFNKTAVPVPRMSELLREQAHALVEAALSIDADEAGIAHPVLAGEVEYRLSGATSAPLRGRRFRFRHGEAELSSLLPTRDDPAIDLDALIRLGPFSMKCYWFNRRLLKSIELDDALLDVKKLVRQWSGGLMVYRDGFRVAPYGGPDDDWLDLDRGALAAQGYKVNRAQLVGKVDITAEKNRPLRDQTNREGLRDCPEKRVLVALLKYILEVEFRGYLKDVDDEVRERERISFGVLAEQLAEVEERINTSLETLGTFDAEHPDLKAGALSRRLKTAYQTVVRVVEQMQDSVESAEDERARLLHLAALGLSIEKLAHELNRATRHALQALQQIGGPGASPELKRTAALQLQSLQKRLQTLDPLLTPARHRKEEFDLVGEVRSVLAGYDARFERHNIQLNIDVKPDGPIRVKLVRAMLIQVLENLIDNSVYWLTVGTRRKAPLDKERAITIVIDGRRNVLEFSDTGPGIAPENRDRVFRAFFTLKPAGQGKGLGLYIAREIAEYHGGSLTLSDRGLRSSGRLHTFVLDFGSGRN